MSMTEAAENRLWAALNTRAGGRPLDVACDAALYNFIRAGIARMEDAGQLDDGARIALAEQNIIRFIDCMLADAPAGSVPLEAFEHTRRHLCPLWPFCDSRDEAQGEEESPWG